MNMRPMFGIIVFAHIFFNIKKILADYVYLLATTDDD